MGSSRQTGFSPRFNIFSQIVQFIKYCSQNLCNQRDNHLQLNTKILLVLTRYSLYNLQSGILQFYMQVNSNISPATENQSTTQANPQMESSQELPFADRIQNPKWQIRKTLYENLVEIFSNGQPLTNLSSSFVSIESFCPWFRSMLNDPHPSCFIEALKAIQMFTRKCPITVGSINTFLSILIDKTGSTVMNMKIAEDIIANCCNTYDKGMFVLSELSKHVHHKNPKIALFAIQSISTVLTKYQLKDQKQIIAAFNLHKQILQETANKDIRTTAIQNMVNILQYIEEEFEDLCKHEFKKVRPVVLKELAAAMKINPKGPVQDNTSKQKHKQNTEESLSSSVDLFNVMPEKVPELKIIQDPNIKLKILAQVDIILSKLMNSKITAKDYSQIFHQFESPLEDQNFLVTSATLKVLKNLLILCPVMVSLPNFKRLLFLTADKYKGSKSKTFNIQLHQMLTHFYSNKSVSIEQMVDFLVDILEKSKNLNAKIGVLEWFATEFKIVVQKQNQQGNAGKIKKVCTNLKKRFELMAKLDQFLKVKEDLRSVIAVLENIDGPATEPIQPIKSQTAINFNKKVEGSNQNINLNRTLFNSKSKEKPLKPSKSPIRKSQLVIRKHESPPIKTIQSEQALESIPMLIFKKLQMIKQQACKGAKQHIINGQFNKIRNILIENKQNFEDTLDLLVNFGDEIACVQINKNRNAPPILMTPRIREAIFDWILNLIATINCWVKKIDNLCVKKQLQVILIKISPSADATEGFLQNLKEKGDFDSILKSSAALFKQKGCNPIIKQIVSHFLRQELSLQQGSEPILKSCYKQFLQTDGQLALMVKGRLRNSTVNQDHSAMSAVSQSRNRFGTPTKQLSDIKQEQNSHSKSRERTASNLSAISETITMYEDKIIENVVNGTQQFKKYIERVISETDSLEKKQHTALQYRKILKSICVRVNLGNWQEIKAFLLFFKSTFKQHRDLLAKIFLTTVCLTNIFANPEMQNSRDNLFEALFQNCDKSSVLLIVRECFSSVYKTFKDQEQTKQFVLNVLPYLIESQLNLELTIKQCEYLAQILVFCLGDEKLSMISTPYLQKIHQSRSTFTSIQKLFEMKIGRHEQLLSNYKKWIQTTLEASAAELADGTIADLTQIHQISYEQDSKIGLEAFLNQQRTPGDRLKDRSPGPSKKANRSERKSPINSRNTNGSAEGPKQFLANMERQLEELEKSLEYSKVSQKQQKTLSQIKQVDVYDVEKNKAKQLTQGEQQQNVEDCVKQLQQMFLTCEQNSNDLLDTLWETYSSLKDSLHRQDQFINDLRSCILNPDFLTCLSQVSYKMVLKLLLKLCSNIPLERQQVDSSKTIQYLLHVVLSYKNPNKAVMICISILSESTPTNLRIQLQFSDKIMLRLLTNCIQKLSSLLKPVQMRTFEVLMEIYKYFKAHPPQQLVVGLPSVKEYEYVFRVLRAVSDQFIAANAGRAQDLIKFVKRKNVANIYLDYLEAALN